MSKHDVVIAGVEIGSLDTLLKVDDSDADSVIYDAIKLLFKPPAKPKGKKKVVTSPIAVYLALKIEKTIEHFISEKDIDQFDVLVVHTQGDTLVLKFTRKGHAKTLPPVEPPLEVDVPWSTAPEFSGFVTVETLFGKIRN